MRSDMVYVTIGALMISSGAYFMTKQPIVAVCGILAMTSGIVVVTGMMIGVIIAAINARPQQDPASKP